MQSVNKGFLDFADGPLNRFPSDRMGYIFDRKDAVETYLESIALQNSSLKLIKNNRLLVRKDHESLTSSVKLLTGGEAGSDPLYSGCIGPGMLTGAVFGELRKSPPHLTILEALRILSVKNNKGILVIVMNNLANRLNFGLACQKAAKEGIYTLCVYVGEDVSGVNVNKTVGRLGHCGILFVYKIAGALADEMKTLIEIYKYIERLKGSNLASVCVGLKSDVMTIGPGRRGDLEKLYYLWDTFDNMEDTARLNFIVKQALAHIFHPSSYYSLNVVKGEQIVVITNNLGYLTDFNFNTIVKEVLDQISTLGFTLVRIYTGRYFNSDEAGFSISVMKVTNELLKLLDHPVKVFCWPHESVIPSEKEDTTLSVPTVDLHEEKKELGPRFTKPQATQLNEVLYKIIYTVSNMEEYLNSLDTDNDFGTSMKKFVDAIRNKIDTKNLQISTPYSFLQDLSNLAGLSMGGVAGGVFSILCSSAAEAFLSTSPLVSPDIACWMRAIKAAKESLQKFTRVQPGDGTILDALHPFVETYKDDSSVKNLSKQVNAAISGVTETEKKINGMRSPDPGALCVAAVIRAVFTTLQVDLAEAEVEMENDDVLQFQTCLDELTEELIGTNISGKSENDSSVHMKSMQERKTL